MITPKLTTDRVDVFATGYCDILGMPDDWDARVPDQPCALRRVLIRESQVDAVVRSVQKGAWYSTLIRRYSWLKTLAWQAEEAAKETTAIAVPLHIRNAPTRLMKDLGYGEGYAYNPQYACVIKSRLDVLLECHDARVYLITGTLYTTSSCRRSLLGQHC